MNYQTSIKKYIKDHKILTTCVVLFFLLTAITHKYGPYMGKVVDAETGKPIEGAVVYMVFYTRTPNPAGSSGHYAGAAETLTDANGKFFLRYRAFVFHPFSFWDPWPAEQVFKPGYVVFPGRVGNKRSIILPENRKMPGIPEKQYVTIKLPKLTTREEREDNLASVDSRKSYVPYKKRKYITELENKERVNLGYNPLGEK